MRRSRGWARRMKQPESSLADSVSRSSPSCSTGGSCEWDQTGRHEAEVELAPLGRVRRRGRRIIQLPILRALSDYAGFSVGEPVALRDRRGPAAGRFVSRVWPAASLSWQDLRLDLHRHSLALVRVSLLRNILRFASGSTFGAGATHWRESSGFHVAGPGRQTGGACRFTFAQWHGADFLSRLLVTTL